jgi:RNA polymerase sigma-70 factor (ECF subfamily)
MHDTRMLDTAFHGATALPVARSRRRSPPRGNPLVAAAGRVCSDSLMEAAPGKPLASVVPDGGPNHASALRQRLDGLFKEHAPYVARIAHRVLGREDEVDDIVQEVFIILFRHLDRIRRSESVRAWLATTTVRMVRRRLRVRRIGMLLRVRDQVDPMELQGTAVSGEDRAALWKVHLALEGVGANARIAWVFRYLEQEEIDEVARLCRCSRSTAKRRIADAHRVVKRALSDD